jgi:hypothetical protein
LKIPNYSIKNRTIIYQQETKWQRRKEKVRSDKQVGNLEKDLGLPPGTIRNKDGRDSRSDKTVGTVRKEQEKK